MGVAPDAIIVKIASYVHKSEEPSTADATVSLGHKELGRGHRPDAQRFLKVVADELPVLVIVAGGSHDNRMGAVGVPDAKASPPG